jgi:hypothetical protein
VCFTLIIIMLFVCMHVCVALDIPPVDLNGGDVLDEVRSILDPLESAITRNILAAREQRVLLNSAEERLAVLRVVTGSAEITAVSGLAAQGVPRNYGSVGEQSALLSVIIYTFFTTRSLPYLCNSLIMSLIIIICS